MAVKDKFLNIPVDEELRNFFDGMAANEDTSVAHIARVALREFKRKFEASDFELSSPFLAQQKSRGDNAVVVPSRCLGTRNKAPTINENRATSKTTTKAKTRSKPI